MRNIEDVHQETSLDEVLLVLYGLKEVEAWLPIDIRSLL